MKKIAWAQHGTEDSIRGEVLARHFAGVSACSVMIALDHVYGFAGSAQ